MLSKRIERLTSDMNTMVKAVEVVIDYYLAVHVEQGLKDVFLDKLDGMGWESRLAYHIQYLIIVICSINW